MAKKQKSQFAILGVLALSPDISGYDIRQEMATSTDFFWKETFSSIYPVLQKLEKEGMIVKKLDASSGKRERHLYRLAPKGEKLLQEWLKEAPEPHQVRSEILLKLFLGPLCSPGVSVKHIQDYKEALSKRKKALIKIKERLESLHKNEPGLPYWLITLDHGLKTIDASVQWCEESLVKLIQIGG